MTFDSLGLQASLLKAVADSGYTSPTPIQQQAIPAVLEGRDLMAAAQTGTGKTAGFVLPLLQRLDGRPSARSHRVRALVLVPTRELAAQVQESIETYGKYGNLRSLVVFGGVNINPQRQALGRGTDILVATPGRLLDLHQQDAVRFDDIEVLVLDEADRMLDMGFIRDIRRILALLPKKRQNLLFSATFSDDIRALAKTLCHNPREIDVAPRNSTVERIEQQVYHVGKDQKLPLLAKLLQETDEQVLVFSRTKHGANNMVKKLAGFDIQAAAIHGNKSQAQRTRALADFKDNRIQVLVATDIAARGIDIDQLAMVINHDLPNVPEDYVHRIGRTGRAGASGLAVSLVGEDENRLLRDIERLIRLKITRQDFDPGSLPKPVRQVETAAVQQARPARSANANGHGHHGGHGGGNGGGNGSGGNGGGRRSRRGGSASTSQRSTGSQQRSAGGHQRSAGGQQRSGGGRQAAHRGLSGNR